MRATGLFLAGLAWVMTAAAAVPPVENIPPAQDGAPAFSDCFFDWGLFASRLEDLHGTRRVRAAGPFFEKADGEGGAELRAFLRPVWSRAVYPAAGRTGWDFVWPVAQGKMFGEQKSWRVLTAYFHDQNTNDPESLYRFWAVPLWFHGRGNDRTRYAALFPIGGSIRDFLWKDRMTFVLWPIWMNSQINDVTTTDILFPIISRTTTPDGHIDKFRVFPFYARSTNQRQQFEKRTILWPFWTQARYAHPKAEGKVWILFPLVGRIDLKNQKGWMFLPPLIQHIRGEQMSRTFAPWPFFIRETGYRDKLYIWPLYGHRRDGELMRRFWLWPFIINEENEWGHSHLSRWSLVPFFLNITQTEPVAPSEGVEQEEGASPPSERRVTAKHTKLWPLYTRSYNTKADSFRWRLLDIWPAPNPPPIERSWAPLWTLWDYRGHGEDRDLDVVWGLYRQTRREGDERSFSLFPLWRHDRAETAGERRWSVLKGLIAYDRTATNRQIRFLWLGRMRLKTPEAAGPDSP